MTLAIGTQNPVLNLMNPNGTIAVSLILPPTDKHSGINLKWKNTGHLYTQPNGVPVMVYNDPTSKFVPIITLKWSVYDTTGMFYLNPNGYGVTNGQTPTLEQLINVLGIYSPYLLQIWIGTGYGGFNCFVSKDISMSPLSGLVYENVQIEFTGTSGFATMAC
jgi:hypothetical protein